MKRLLVWLLKKPRPTNTPPRLVSNSRNWIDTPPAVGSVSRKWMSDLRGGRIR